MKEFALTDLARRTAAVRSAAMREPVVITEHETRRLVVMSYEDYEALTARPNNPRRAFKMADLEPEEAARIVALLEQPFPGENE
ncbi:type II toxin-antitoxin system prevent-host-death family antitoxin [Caulobacter sp. CCH5-E12]|jgi:prevent-host-death family protein|uniref:type II toxin-antitoxin system prevent-host-death family antitoxin n=1 Tax=Caulobacter sp. CCH5-E12 TaxID=1768770 RepID=UPI0009E7A8FB|nr:type II toxin-antitoxin system prevent-host-death family antitoxin [Caulobacter sp. CCH5-E12]